VRNTVHRLLPDQDAEDLISLIREFAADRLVDRASDAEAAAEFPREAVRELGKLGVLGLPHPVVYGGSGLGDEVTMQVIEELATAWATVGLAVSVHFAACHPMLAHGTDEQRAQWLPDMIGGELLGGFCLSEPHAGSDVGALSTRAVRNGDDYVITGQKAWITHGGQADFYTVMARTSDDGSRGVSCFHVPADTPGITTARPERKMGMNGSPTTAVYFQNVVVPAAQRIGPEGKGVSYALEALDTGRLCIAAVATGIAQAAFGSAVEYASGREQFGQPIIDFQGVSFLLADMAAAVHTGRLSYLDACRRKDLGVPFSREAAIAKLVATDNAMRVTTDAVQVLGGAGYTRDHPVERYMREAKITQIFEGTNQIQRLVIGRSLATS
jgi:alkylation response protein AidB-like acyl-CoA dehydrogenase